MLLALAALWVAAPAGAAELKVGDMAPDFKMQGSDGKTHQLSDYRGKQAVVLAWFPKAFTGGCTKECKSFRDNGEAVRKYDVAYFTASVDTPEVNKKFAQSLNLDYPILSDPDKKAAQAYGVLRADRPFAKRWTFYIGEDGKILYIDKKVKTASHGQDVAQKLDQLGVEKKK
jgi:peroxiredoxin Q/BCP